MEDSSLVGKKKTLHMIVVFILIFFKEIRDNLLQEYSFLCTSAIKNNTTPHLLYSYFKITFQHSDDGYKKSSIPVRISGLCSTTQTQVL